MTEWTKCCDKVPIKGQEVVVKTKKGHIYTAKVFSREPLIFDVTFSSEYVASENCYMGKQPGNDLVVSMYDVCEWTTPDKFLA